MKPRHILFPLIVALELCLLLLLDRQPGPRPSEAKPGQALSVFALAESADEAAPAPAPTPPEEIAIVVEVPPMIPSLLTIEPITMPLPLLGTTGDAVPTAGAPGEACDLAADVQQALRASPEVAQSISTIPRRERSVANAIMLWDGRWHRSGPLRDTVLAAIDRASPACRDQLVRGPRLISLPTPVDTLVIALGSGAWRWADLARGDDRDTQLK